MVPVNKKAGMRCACDEQGDTVEAGQTMPCDEHG
jgi:hypothetical protein